MKNFGKLWNSFRNTWPLGLQHDDIEGAIRVSQIFSFVGVEMDWDIQCDELWACEDYAYWMWFREQERQAALDVEQDICPSCGRIGGEYTPTLDCCAYC